ncbi:transposase, partial [Candidatus Omnitrophota bacterium]
MPRGSRLILDSACYHVTSRGNEGNITFKKEDDYERYLKLLIRYKHRFDFKLYCWCLMNNHVHMVIESARLSKVMHGINLSHAKYFRDNYGGMGHFWQDRFKSYVIQKDRYLINCITYIEYNPVRAKIVQRPEDYKWSSYRSRVLGEKCALL